MQRAYGPAIECVSRAIDLKGDDPDYFYARGRYYLKLDNFSAAENDFTRTIQLCRDTQNEAYLVPGLFFRAFTYYHLNLPDKLREDCANVPDEFKTWIDKIISKEELLDMAALLERKSQALFRKRRKRFSKGQTRVSGLTNLKLLDPSDPTLTSPSRI